MVTVADCVPCFCMMHMTCIALVSAPLLTTDPCRASSTAHIPVYCTACALADFRDAVGGCYNRTCTIM